MSLGPGPSPDVPFDDVGLVIFDCDGVLVDSERLAVRIEALLLNEMGWSISEAEIVERFMGRSDAYMMGEIEKGLGRPVPDWTARYESALHDAFHADLTPVAGVVEALDIIEAAGLPTCVASSGTHDKMRMTLGLTGLRSRFEGRISSASEVKNGKPAPDLFLLAAQRAGVAPERCVVVEDSRSGIEGAWAAGMRSVGYAGGLTAADRLAGPGTTVIHSMDQLPKVLGLG